MVDLILKTRLDILRSNLRRVTEMGSNEAGSIEKLRAELRELLNLPTDEEMMQPLRNLTDLVRNSKGAIEFDSDSEDTIGKIYGNLESMEQDLEAIRKHLSGILEAANIIKSRTLNIRQGSAWPSLHEGLVVKAAKQIGALGHIEDDLLARAAEAEGRGEHAAAKLLKKSAWEEYSGTLYRESDQVLSEYLDLLCGLALRDTGLDQGMCRIADTLIRDAGRLPDNFTWDSLTIPAQREALQATLAKIIRLGFPEWTIWTLPMAAHEFGHVAVSINAIEQFVAQRTATEDDRRRLRVCLADAFATYIMGPAYACAVILVRLDPVAAFAPDELRLTEKRARVVLAMLHHMDGMAAPSEQGPYDAIHDRLESEWNEALQQAGSADVLTPQEEAEIEIWVDLISSTMGFRGLSAGLWPRIEQLARCLDLSHIDGLKVQTDDELRVVLNAAWKRRIDETSPSIVDEVAQAALKLWQRIEEARNPRNRSSKFFPRAAALVAKTIAAGPADGKA